MVSVSNLCILTMNGKQQSLFRRQHLGMVLQSGQQRKLTAKEIGWHPVEWKTFNNRNYPIGWQLSIPSQQINLSIDPINKDQYFDGTIPYWEGAITTQGSHLATGYLELFGY